MATNLSETIDIISSEDSSDARYDASIKEVLADKQILARILKYTLEEFKDLDIETIMANIDEPVVSAVRIEPGHTNTEKIQKTSEEDNVLGEGKIYYDIRFSVYCGEELIKILINIEAQKSTKSSKLGYHLDNRILYYLARMVSAQKEIEFVKSDYDKLKAVRSIWICMDTADDEDSINRLHIVQDTLYGKDIEFTNLDKVQGIVIRLREKDNVETSKNTLIAMLEELLRNDDKEAKKKKLSEKYGLIMNTDTERRINTMCNLSEALIERTTEKALEQGKEEEKKNSIRSMYELGLSVDKICQKYDAELVKEVLNLR